MVLVKDGGMTEAAISIASINIVKMLLDNGADINARNNVSEVVDDWFFLS